MGVEDDGPAGPVASLLVRGGAGAVPAWCISAGAVVLVLCCGAGAVLWCRCCAVSWCRRTKPN